jgi:hypothetical protein
MEGDEMKSLTRITIIATALILLTAGFSAADFQSQPGYTVALMQGDVSVAEVLTDDAGAFSFVDVVAGSYLLQVTDPAGAVELKFALDVPVEKEPALVAGRLTTDPDQDVGLQITANALGEGEIAATAIDSAAISPRKWNRKFLRSRGKVKVKLSGTGLEAVSLVTMESVAGTISTDDIVLDEEEEGKAKAVFRKAEAFEALIPEDAVRGDRIEVTVLVTYPGDVQSFEKSVILLGKTR